MYFTNSGLSFAINSAKSVENRTNRKIQREKYPLLLALKFSILLIVIGVKPENRDFLFFIKGKIEIELIPLIVIILAAPFRLIFLKNVVSIQFDSNSQTLIINQKNGFEVPYSKKLNLEETDLSPITENKNELEFDLLGKNKFIRIGSNQRGIAKSDVISIHNYLQEKFDLKVIIIK